MEVRVLTNGTQVALGEAGMGVVAVAKRLPPVARLLHSDSVCRRADSLSTHDLKSRGSRR